MSEPENFLERWSRRKAAPKDENESAVEKPAATDENSQDLPPAENDEGAGGDSIRAKSDGKEAEPEFDLSKLPSIDSITATTDIRMFMLPGVPFALRQAALRKVWVTDPKIRDFIEMAENQWDFTVNSPGFDFSPPTGDIKEMLAEIFGKGSEEEKKPEASPETAKETASPDPEPEKIGQAKSDSISATEEPVSTRLSEQPSVPARASLYEPEQPPAEQIASGNIASQNNDASHMQETTEQEIPRRRHGSALPG